MKINGKPIVDLPECTIALYQIPFNDKQRIEYNKVESACKNIVQQFVADDSFGRNWGMVLVMMTRLRQYCDHTGLIPQNFIDDLADRDFQSNAVSIEILEAAMDCGEGKER